jgi:ribonuclease P/MRP protein subunit POP1
MKRTIQDEGNDDTKSKRKRIKNKQSWKRSNQHSTTSAPAFTDVTASVSAATFPARRLPELRQLYQQRKFLTPSLLDTSGFESGGGKTSSRHLRRRASSFQPRKRHRYPAGGGGVGEGRTQLSPHNKLEKDDDKEILKQSQPNPPPNRRKQRRNRATLIQKHSSWTQACEATSTPTPPKEEGETSQEDIHHHWIPTHLWHTKRFHIHDLWGWKVPLLHTNRGIRATLRLVKEHPVVQDVTWRTQPIHWHIKHGEVTPLKTLVQALGRILVNWNLDQLSENLIKQEGEFSSLLMYGECLLHDVDKHPWVPIGPVTYLVKTQPLLSKSSSSGIYFYVWGHPQIQDKLWYLIQTVLGTLDGVQELACGMNIGCLSIRGNKPTDCLQRCLLKHYPNIDLTLPLEKLKSIIYQSSSTIECIWTQQRDPTLPCNLGVNGIDIFASPEAIRQLFVQLATEGGACPIGLIDDGALRLECQPPLPVFPRDFPDTEAGTHYWQPGESRDLLLLREYDYGSIGRIRSSPLSSTSVFWNKLVPDFSGPILLVRGAFLKPFHDAWTGLGGIKYEVQSDNARKQKKRRKVINPVALRKIPNLPRALVDNHESFCEGLAQSLTLPATVLCHVDVDGPGKLEIGMPLYRWSTDSSEKNPLGYVCAASFSPWRGYFHGTAVVGADTLLQAIAGAHADGTAFTRRKIALGSLTCLLVYIGNAQNVRGTLRLLY